MKCTDLNVLISKIFWDNDTSLQSVCVVESNKMLIVIQIRMPSGSSVTARHTCFGPEDCMLDVAVYPLVEDADHSEGLCGNYNGNSDDDRLPKDSTVVDTDSEPVTFVGSYMYVVRFCRY